MDDKSVARIRRAMKTRSKLHALGATRLVVHRTIRHMYAQIIAPKTYKVLVVASTLENNIAESVKSTGNKEAAAAVGRMLAKRAIIKGIEQVSFDRSGYKYHGRVLALANAARKVGLKF